MQVKKYIALSIISIAILVYAVSFYIQKKEDSYLISLQGMITQEQSVLTTLSELTNKNAVDTYAAGIITDCPTKERARFDDLLGTLNTLQAPELTEVNQLFTGCASYDAEQKALMTARLQREVEVYVQFINLIQTVDTKNTTDYKTTQWKQIVDFEKQRTELSQKLVQIQKDIIVYLLKGKTADSSEIRTLLEQAQEAKDTLSYIRVKIDALNEQINKT